MREKKYHIYLTDDEQSRVIQSLINLKNNLILLAFAPVLIMVDKGI